MESADSSPNYMRATSSFDAKKGNSPGGSECDDIISVNSSTCGSAINGTPKHNKSGIKYRTNNKKTVKKNFGNVKSFRRRAAKSRFVQSPEPTPSEDEDSLADSCDSSPNYLKATSCSEGKKMHFQASPSPKPLKALSRTSSSLRNVRILIKKTSFNPNRSSLSYSKVSEDVPVDRATYSSTLKDSKFPEAVVLHSGGAESEKDSVAKVCRYHHCSLHGHCHGDHDSVPPVKQFLYKRRWLLKKQKSMIPKSESRVGAKNSSSKKKNLKKSEIVPTVEQLNREGISESVHFSVDETKNELDTCAEMCPEEEQIFGDRYADIQEAGLIEVAFGETSFPERSYQDNVNMLMKYSSQEQEFGGRSSRPEGYCLSCSCHKKEQVMPTSEVLPSSLDGNNNEIPQSGIAIVLDTSSSALLEKPNEEFSTFIEDIAAPSCANEASNKDYPETPVKVDEVTKKNTVFSSASYSQTSSDNNSEEGESITDSTAAGGSKVVEVMHVKDSDTNSPTQGGKLQFRKPRHISMWNLIHQHMLSNLPAESTNKPLEDAGGETPVDGVDSLLAKESTALRRDLSDSDAGTMNNDSEVQEIELRKLFAIKLVREAIEKILLPEVQDQTSDDQSVTSESTPRPELVEENQTKAHAEENHVECDADKGEGNPSSNPKEESLITDEASGPEIKETKKNVVKKSEKKAPKHWSNLKKWILLQRFIRELEKVRRFNPRKPQYLPLNPDPKAEKVNLRPQTVDEKKNSQEWMLDYALCQAVNQLAPTQKRKVALLVKAFETVVPSQEDSPVQFRIPRLKDNGLDASRTSYKVEESLSEGHEKNKEEAPVKGKSVLARDASISFLDSVNQENGIKMTKKTEKNYGEFRSSSGERVGNGKSVASEPSFTTRSLIFDGNRKTVVSENTLGPTEITADETEREALLTPQGLQKDAVSDFIEGKNKESDQSIQMDRKNHIKMWHMIYQHVVSGIAEKIGSQLLDGVEDDEVENASPATNNGDFSNDFTLPTDDSSEKSYVSSNLRNGFTKSDALKLVKEAVDEILLPELQDDSLDTQSVMSESIPEQDILERNCSGIGGENISREGDILMDEGKRSSHDIVSTHEESKTQSQVNRKIELSNSKNWSKLKKLILLKRSIRALEKARKLKPQPQQLFLQTPDPEPEKVDLRRQMTDERKKAEQWMLDYAVQHIVTKLTPARKRRVSMLVEAFEAVVPLPEICQY